MSRSAEISLYWADEDRIFRLGLKQLERLQERCGERGPKRLLNDLLGGEWRVRDITETIRLGLVGGGMKPEEADKLVKANVEEEPLEHNVLYAVAILQAVLVGPPLPEVAGKGPAPPGEPTTATTGSTSPPSTEQEPSSVGALARSVN